MMSKTKIPKLRTKEPYDLLSEEFVTWVIAKEMKWLSERKPSNDCWGIEEEVIDAAKIILKHYI